MNAPYIVSICIVFLAAAVLVFQRWFMRTGAVPEVIAQAERTSLLEAIGEAATEPKMRVTLRGFWGGRGWSRREKASLLRPLVSQRILHIPYSNDQPQRFFEVVWHEMLAQPPGAVTLNSRDWTRMATDRSGKEPSIIIGKISGGNVQVGGHHNNMTQQELSAEQLASLVEALREDAGASASADDAALGAADGIERGLEIGRLSSVTEHVKSAAALAESSAGAMEATRRVLHALGIL